jgi:O-antigen/teichoic acid export membrane protein
LNLNKYISNFNWLFLEKVIRIFGALFIGFWIARYLGPERFGMLNYSIAFVAFFSFFSALGLKSIIIREITKNEEKYEKIIGTTFYLKLIGGIVAFVLGVFFIYTFKIDDVATQNIVILLLLGYIFQSMDVIDYFFQAKVLSKYVVIARTLAFMVSNGLKIYFIVFQFSVIYFVFAVVLDMFLSSLFMFLIYKKMGFVIQNWKLDIVLAKSLLKDSWPLMLSAFFITIYMKIDQIMIEYFLNMQSVGLYSVAVSLSEAWYFIPTIIISSLMPYFVKVREMSMSLYLYRLKQVYTLMFWMSIIVGVVVTFFGQEIIIFAFTEVYKDAYLALVYNIWAGIFVSMGMASTLWLIAENLQIYSLFGTAIGVFLNIIANFILIPEYGISGAAIATLITQGFGLWVVPLFFKPIRLYVFISITSIMPIYLIKGKK